MTFTCEDVKQLEIDLQKQLFEVFWEQSANTRRIRCLYQRV